jgi:spermidine synthase
MTRPWTTLASAPSSDGLLELRKRGGTETTNNDFMITVGGRVLMNSFARASEEQLAALGLAHAKTGAPRVLIGGLGMGFTLRAALNALPAKASVHVAELNAVIVEWCRGPLATATRNAVDDPRVRVEVTNVMHVLHDAKAGTYDAILFDLYEGPNTTMLSERKRQDDPLYGSHALGAARSALAETGVFAIWAEDRDDKFVTHFRACGFEVDVRTLTAGGSGGRKHVVYLGTRVKDRRASR